MGSKSPIVRRLDDVQHEIARILKPARFARKGRTFRRETEPGIFQIIAFQAGPFEIGPPLPEPVSHLRKDYYGKFTVNLGVFVEEIDERSNPPINKSRVISDAHCSIRTRLGHITSHEDTWWSLLDEQGGLAEDIGALIIHVGIPFLDRFGTRDQIVRDWISFNENELAVTRVARLDVAMILLKAGDREGARRLFQDHLAGTELKSHAGYVRELAVKLGLGELA